MSRRRRWILVSLLLLAVLGWVGLRALVTGMMVAGDETGLTRSTAEVTLPNGLDIEVSALSSGDGSPRLIYVHGTPGDATNWSAYLRRPVGGLPSVAVDRPGFGRSTNGRAFPGFGDQAAALAPWLEQAGERPAILIGHSLGAPIIARAAADYPERVGALVIVAGSLDPELEELRWYNRLLDLPLVARLFPAAIGVSNDEVMEARTETKTLATLLERVTCPIFILHGTDDGLVPVANVDYMQRAFVNAATLDVRLLEGADHFLIWSREGEVRRMIEKAVAVVGSGV